MFAGRCLLVGIFLLGIRPHAFAQADCSVTASGVVFGDYDTNSVQASDTAARIVLDCTAMSNLVVAHSLFLGTGASNSYVARQMSNGAALLAYNLYVNAAHSAVWGDGTAGSAFVSDSFMVGSIGTVKTYTVYGSTPARQNVFAGMYSDFITVTVMY